MAKRDKGLPTLRELDLITARTVAYQQGVHAGRKAGRAELAASIGVLLEAEGCSCDMHPDERPDDINACFACRISELLLAASAGGDARPAEPERLGEPCVGCGKRSRIFTAGCDHCDYEDK